MSYENEPMTRARAQEIRIAFSLAVMHEQVPIRVRKNGLGYDAVLPLEFVAALPGVKRHLPPAEADL